jgi:hypothetical protein
MALFFECMQQCARKVLDTADIVRDAMLQQLSTPLGFQMVSKLAIRRDCFRVADKLSL